VSAAPSLLRPRGTRAAHDAGPAGRAGATALLTAEWRKMRRTWILPLTFLGPLGVTLMGVIFYYLRGEIVAKEVARGVPPFMILMNGMALVHIFALMLGTTLLASQLADVEHRSDTWKQLFSMPVSRGGTFAAKLLWLVALLAVASVLMVAGYAAIWVWKGYGAIPWTDFARVATFPYLAVLPMAALQLLWSVRSANQAMPMTAGILGTMFSMGAFPIPPWTPYAMPHHALFTVFGKPLAYPQLWQAVAVETVLLGVAGAVLLSRTEIR
jgi:hypothetical protein